MIGKLLARIHNQRGGRVSSEAVARAILTIDYFASEIDRLLIGQDYQWSIVGDHEYQPTPARLQTFTYPGYRVHIMIYYRAGWWERLRGATRWRQVYSGGLVIPTLIYEPGAWVLPLMGLAEEIKEKIKAGDHDYMGKPGIDFLQGGRD